MAVAVFDYAAFSALFPELVAGGVTEQVASSFFSIATLFLDNTDCSPVQDVGARLTMLNYVTAHLASLAGYPLPAGGTVPAPSGIVGRISSATEGSVSVGSEIAAMTNAQSFWVQSQYGAIFWAMTRSLRTMRYVAAPRRNFGPAGLPGFGGGARFGYNR